MTDTTSIMLRTDAELCAFAFQVIREMEKEIRETFWDEFKMTCVKFQFGVRRSGKGRRSWGGYDGWKKGMSGKGGGYVEIAMARFRYRPAYALLPDGDDIHMTEYRHIKKDPVIGEFKGSRAKVLKALIAHEVAHALEHVSKIKLSNGLARDILDGSTISSSFRPHATGRVKGHGDEWQKIYAHLRVKFVNSMK